MLDVSQVRKEYRAPGGPLTILSGVSFSFERGDAVAIMGPSGAGKSTLLYILGGLEQPTSGTVLLDGRNPYHCLLPQCSVLENVLVPTLVAQDAASLSYMERARQLLDQVGLSDRLNHRPAELSGGEKQRVALARALIRKPLLLLCDEPTGNLDQASADVVAALLLELRERQETILVVVTHSAELASRFPARYELHHANLHAVGA
jgi:lipoprotein-releasing system ATP-binding protein